MWKGNSKESLLSKLKELDEQISIDSVIRPGQKVKVTATADGCGFRNWAIEPDPEGYKAAKPVSGGRFGKFCDMVEHLAERRDVEIYSLKVLAYSGIMAGGAPGGCPQNRRGGRNPNAGSALCNRLVFSL